MNNFEHRQQEASIELLLLIEGAMVEDLAIVVLGVLQNTAQELHELRHSQQRRWLKLL